MNRQEWLAWRKKGIGSSDAPIIMGVSPWGTKVDLFEQKVSDTVEEDESNQYVKDLGNEAEPKIRSLFSLLMADDFQVALLEMDGFPLIASLDGRSTCKTKIIEIKLSGKEDFEGAQKGKVPEKYIPQIQHQLMVSKAEVCYFLSYSYAAYKESKAITADNLAIVEVKPDKEYQATLMQEELKFWQENVVPKRPPIPGDKDYKPLRGVAKEVKKWKSLKAKIDELEAQLEAVRAEIIAKAETEKHPRFVCSGVRIRQESRVGNVNYKNIPELKGVDLEKYRGKGSTSWKFEVLDDKE